MADDSLVRFDRNPHDIVVARSRTSRLLWNIAGTFFLSLGAVGIVIPLLPTTPFLLLAAACYLRGSARMYNWMLTNRYFGVYLKNYIEGKGIPPRVRIATIVLLWTVIGFSATLMTDSIVVRIALLLVAFGVSIHILTLKGK
jgi:uncharacterized membrane protein YbaN (DUF454 family)